MIRKSTHFFLVQIEQFTMIFFYTPSVINYHIYNSSLHLHWSPQDDQYNFSMETRPDTCSRKHLSKERSSMQSMKNATCWIQTGSFWIRSRFSSYTLYHIQVVLFICSKRFYLQIWITGLLNLSVDDTVLCQRRVVHTKLNIYFFIVGKKTPSSLFYS